MKKNHWFKGVFLLVWGLLGALAHELGPFVTGNRVIDAILISAAVTFLLVELVEVLWGVLLLLAGRRWRRDVPDQP